jgi:hypothetical protein
MYGLIIYFGVLPKSNPYVEYYFRGGGLRDLRQGLFTKPAFIQAFCDFLRERHYKEISDEL